MAKINRHNKQRLKHGFWKTRSCKGHFINGNFTGCQEDIWGKYYFKNGKFFGTGTLNWCQYFYKQGIPFGEQLECKNQNNR